jgi:AcrR family transcriptional regulator
MDQRRTDTREQLQSVALELFTERGYDSTSLREIADRLGITKAAVYYHFRSKGEIVASLIDDLLSQLDDLVQWGRTQPQDSATRIEVLRRYSEMLSGRTAELSRFVREGRSPIHELDLGIRIQARYVELCDLLSPPGDPVEGRLRARVALSSLHIGTTTDPQHTGTDTQRRATALAIATQIVVPPEEPLAAQSRAARVAVPGPSTSRTASARPAMTISNASPGPRTSGPLP